MGRYKKQGGAVMPKWVYFLIGVVAAFIAFQRFEMERLRFLALGINHASDMPLAIYNGLYEVGKLIADGLVSLAFGIISSMGFFLSAKR